MSSPELKDIPFDDPEPDFAPAPKVTPKPVAKPRPRELNGESFEAARPVRAPAVAGRTLPHSLEAEEYLLATILVDGTEVLDDCIEAKISPDTFYDTKHGIVYECMLRMRKAGVPIEAATLVAELQTARQLEQVGGFAFITQVSSRVGTTAGARHFIRQVRDLATVREVIRAATAAVEDCYSYTGDLPGLTSDLRRRLDFAISGESGGRQIVPFDWDAMLSFDPKDDADCLMGRRFLGRTGAAVIVAPSGVGKSVLALQLGACAALGTPFFGMQMASAMRVLYVQAEDDFGDVSESAQGFVRGYGATPEQLLALKERLRIERWNDAAGQRFLDRLAATHRRWPYDLVVINPLFSFCGCNVSEQSELSPFLRNGLNSILNETRAAAIVVHHTNKPPSDPKAGDKAMDAELRYLGSGSAELTNWARAYITLQGVRSAGAHVHKMVFAKRGTRTGIVDEEGHATTSVHIEHSKTGLCWMPSDYATPAGGKFQARFDISKALSVYDSSKSWTENEILIARAMELNPRTVRRHRQAILDHG